MEFEPYLDVIRDKWFDKVIKDDYTGIHEHFASFTPFTLNELLEYGVPLSGWKFVQTLSNILSKYSNHLERQNPQHKVVFYFFQIGVFPRDVFLRSHFTAINRIYIEDNHVIMVYVNRNEYPFYWRDLVDNPRVHPDFNNNTKKNNPLQRFSQACRFAVSKDIQRWRDNNNHNRRCDFCKRTEKQGIKLHVDHKYAFICILKEFIRKNYISNPQPTTPFPTSLQLIRVKNGKESYPTYRFKAENKDFEEKWIQFHAKYKKNNLQWLCSTCNQSKSDISNSPEIRTYIGEETKDKQLNNALVPVRSRDNFLNGLNPTPNGNINMTSHPHDSSPGNSRVDDIFAEEDCKLLHSTNSHKTTKPNSNDVFNHTSPKQCEDNSSEPDDNVPVCVWARRGYRGITYSTRSTDISALSVKSKSKRHGRSNKRLYISSSKIKTKECTLYDCFGKQQKSPSSIKESH